MTPLINAWEKDSILVFLTEFLLFASYFWLIQARSKMPTSSVKQQGRHEPRHGILSCTSPKTTLTSERTMCIAA